MESTGPMAAPQPAAAEGEPGTNLLRDPIRVGVLTALADPFYTVWWLWQFFLFARRERFPRARAFWWLLVPIYNLVVLWRIFDDLKNATKEKVGSSVVQPWLLIVLILAAGFSAVPSARGVKLFALIAGGLMIAPVTYLLQRDASAYLKAKYPQAQPRGFTWGEIVATSLGLLLLLLNLLALMAS